MPRATLLRTAVLLASLILVPGCHSQPQLGVADPAFRTGRKSDVLAAAEMQGVNLNNALEAVMRFRPEFLRSHGSPASRDPNAGTPIVFLDGIRQGSPDFLRSIPVTAIHEIRYLSASSAADQYGPYFPAGVIAVRSRR